MIEKLVNVPDWLKSVENRNLGTVWQAVKAYRANRRQGTVGVKTRSMVASTGKKPYKQKKTGGARRGSFVSPLHRGGGVAHGPKMRDHRESLPKNMSRLALAVSLSKRVAGGKVFFGDLAVPSGKTKDAAAKIKLAQQSVGKLLICLDNLDKNTARAYRNIRGVVLVSPSCINALDVLESRHLVITKNALDLISKRLEL